LTKQEINELYEESVYQIRIKLAIQLMTIKGVTPRHALNEADEFIRILEGERVVELKNKF
jgi:hypothetical protein